MTPEELNTVFKDLTRELHNRATQKYQGCGDCATKGCGYQIHRTPVPARVAGYLDTRLPCPTCAGLRELAKRWECWHEFDTEPKFDNTEFGEIDRSCTKCGVEWILWGKQIIPPDANPTWTVESIKAALESLGDWDGENSIGAYWGNKYIKSIPIGEVDKLLESMNELKDLMLDPGPFAVSATSYLRGLHA